MKRIGQISGTGTLRIGNGVEGRVSYEIDVYEEASGIKSAEGWIDGDYSFLHEAFVSRKPTLTRDDTGEQVGVIISRLTYGRPAEIHVSGSPGTY